MHTKENNPNPAKLIESLRYLGYDNYHAIADLVDNSIDAGAKHIRVLARFRENEPEIIIADDGVGMDGDTLDQAVRLGSLAEKDATSDLGKFGMGLCTASLSICKETTILTKSEDGELHKAINDVDEVKRRNEFVSFWPEVRPHDTSFFGEILGSATSGTILILRKCDNIQNRNMTLFSRILAKQLARIFRYFLSAGVAIYVNDEKLKEIDPLDWGSSEHYDDSEIKIKIDDAGVVVEDVVRIKLAILPDNPAAGEAALTQNIKTQGFYVLRNNREVLDAVTLDFFNKHNDYNRFRGEILFSGKLDKFMGVNFTKRNVSLHQSIFDQLDSHIRGQLKSIRTRVQKQKRVETPDDVQEVHKSVEDEIRRKSKLLITPKAPKEQRESPQKRNGKGTMPHEPSKTREPREKQQSGGIAANCRFETAAMGESGTIYEAEQQGRTIIVRWNSDHPFYQRFVLDYIQDKKIVSAADILVYSLASAELTSANDENIGLINNLKSIMSSNLRTLLS